ncbi:MAG TPA: FAD-binding oxidoreductase [Blastocatellia bacterium]|nr:FAD-binding oxidoreductase [Blastocatellia bacterium]
MTSKDFLTRLSGELSGYVLLPNQDAYQQAVEIDNGRVQQHPSFIIMANSVNDVAIAIRVARTHNMRLTARGGGHSAAGYCLGTGAIAVDLSLMNSISLDQKRRIVRVQMGARWNDVYLYLMNTGTGLIPIGGGCPTVGIPGFMLGGGFSFVSRSYGMSVDNLLSVGLVTADGEYRRVSKDSKSKQDRDLFWACQGGGGGNFGIAVDMEIRVHQPRTPKMFMAQIRYNPEGAQEVLGFYNQWVESLPNELAVYGIWGNQPDPVDLSKTTNMFGFTAVYNGEFKQGIKLVQPLLELKAKPIYAQLNSFTLPEFEEVNGRTTLVKGRSAYIRAGIMPPRSMTSNAIAVLEKYMKNAPSAASFIVWTHAGGKISDVAPNATAFPHRKARFVPELKSIWETPQDARANIEWAYNFFQDLEPHFVGSYVNYIDPLLSNWNKNYYGENYKRLLEIKRYWDPDNLFQFQQSIGSMFEPNTAMPLDLSPLNRTFVD